MLTGGETVHVSVDGGKKKKNQQFLGNSRVPFHPEWSLTGGQVPENFLAAWCIFLFSFSFFSCSLVVTVRQPSSRQRLQEGTKIRKTDLLWVQTQHINYDAWGFLPSCCCQTPTMIINIWNFIAHLWFIFYFFLSVHTYLFVCSGTFSWLDYPSKYLQSNCWNFKWNDT